jgi:hypothetical protein
MIGRLIDWIFSSIAFCITCVIALIILGVALKYWPCLLFGLLLVVVWHLETVFNKKNQNQPEKPSCTTGNKTSSSIFYYVLFGIAALPFLIAIFALWFNSRP